MDAAAFERVVEAAATPGENRCWVPTLRALLDHTAGDEEAAAESLEALCSAAVRYAWCRFVAQGRSQLHVHMHVRAAVRRELERDLATVLAVASRECYALVAQSATLAAEGLFPGANTQRIGGSHPREILSRLFTLFPALARVWAEAIDHWRSRTSEFLERLAADRVAIAREFFHACDPGDLVKLRCALSDPHDRGRTVILLQFERGRLLYKPRSGEPEYRWNQLLQTLNGRGYRPALRIVRVLPRSGYFWMEHVRRLACASRAAVQRFYHRAGALAAAAHLAQAVDCHGGNLIAAGEHPVLIDTETLLHNYDSPSSAHDVAQTGFFVGRHVPVRLSRPILAPGVRGSHVVRLQKRYASSDEHVDEIVAGFTAAWLLLAGTPEARQHFQRWRKQLGLQSRRRVYRPTRTYQKILRLGLTPAALRFATKRARVLEQACTDARIARRIQRQEARALAQLDIPRFEPARAAGTLTLPAAPPSALLNEIRASLRSRRATHSPAL